MREGMEGDFQDLLGAVHFGGEIRLEAGTDVAFNTRDVRVGPDLISRILRNHHVAGFAAKLRGVHVSGAAVTGDGNHEQIDNGSHKNDVEAVPKDAIVEIDAGKFGGNLTGYLQLLAPHEQADGNEDQSRDEEGRQNQERR